MTANLSEGVVNINTSLTGLDRLIQNHRALCRVNDSCAAKDTTDFRTCCMPCSCEASCFSEIACCPEVLTEFWEEPDTEVTPTECLTPVSVGIQQTKTAKRVYRSKDTCSAYMIAKCPEDFENIEIKAKCEQRNGTTLEEHIPVTDTDKTVTFANRYCADTHSKISSAPPVSGC